jgi:hypothetical protein
MEVPRLFLRTRFSHLLRVFDFFGSYKKEHSGKNATNQLMANVRQALGFVGGLEQLLVSLGPGASLQLTSREAAKINVAGL